MSNIVKIEAEYQIHIDTLKVWFDSMLFSFSGVFVDFYLFKASTKEEINFNDPILFI